MKKYNAKSPFLENLSKADLSDVTKRIYLDRWKYMVERHQKDVYYIMTHPKEFIDWIKNTYEAAQTQKSYMSAVLAMFRHNDGMKEQHKKAYDEWFAAFKIVNDTVDERYKKNEPTEKQQEGYVPYEDIVKKRDTLKSGSDERLLLSFYTYIPPLRSDLNQIRIYKGKEGLPDKPEPNYIHMGAKGATMVLHEFKTARHRSDPYEKELPAELVKEIEISLEKDPREYLFQDRSGKPYRSSSFTKWANRTLLRIFDRPLTISLIRHSFINSLDFNKLTIAEKEEIAKSMAHTTAMQDRYRLIF